MRRLYRFYPDFLKILVYEEEYSLDDFRQEALGQTIDENKSALRQLWMWRTITAGKYLFWWCFVVVMIIPMAIWVIFGFSALLGILITVILVLYPVVFWTYIHSYLEKSNGYKMFQGFLGEYYEMLKGIIANQKSANQ